MLAGYGAAQAVPGPRCSPLRPILARSSALGRTPSPAPALGLLGIFLPGLLIMTGVLPFWDGLRTRSAAQAAMRGVNAAVVGLLRLLLMFAVTLLLGIYLTIAGFRSSLDR
jgi:chromate transporter